MNRPKHPENAMYMWYDAMSGSWNMIPKDDPLRVECYSNGQWIPNELSGFSALIRRLLDLETIERLYRVELRKEGSKRLC